MKQNLKKKNIFNSNEMCEKKIFSLVKNIWTFPVLSKQENKTEWMNERESEWEMRREKIKWTSSNVKSFMMIIRIVPNKFDLNKLGYNFLFCFVLSYIDWPSLWWWLMMVDDGNNNDHYDLDEQQIIRSDVIMWKKKKKSGFFA